ncbi:MAG TPA: hypothetical protein VHV81_02955 [Steroidobacteraceae bacterium]|jgi:hypothetical protein|nr:hypothetical protein [Steroidobacteraceae bacterium]
MPVKIILLSMGFLLSWLVLLPVLVIGGGMALFAGATLAEMADTLTGSSPKGQDTRHAREVALRMCTGATPRSLSRR